VTRNASRQSRIIKGFATLASGTMFSRATGMLREIALAFYLGSGAAMDAFVVAFTLPNLFRRILGEKVLESAVLPTYKQLRDSGDKQAADNLIKTTLLLITAIGAFVTGLGIVFAPILVKAFAPGFDLTTHALAVQMSRVMFPFLIFISVAAMFGVILQTREKFGLFAIAPALFNVAIIVFLCVGIKQYGPVIAAWGVLVGGLLEAIVMVPLVRQTFHFQSARCDLKDTSVKKVNRLAIPVFFETVMDKTIVLVDRRLASVVSAGSIAALGYAFRLLQLPYGILVLALARTFYQHLVDAADNIKEFTRITAIALRFMLAVMTPCAAILIVFSDLIVRIVYQRGAFDEVSVNLTASAFACYGIGIIGMTALAILTRAFNALKDTRTPVKVAVVMMILNIVLNYLLVRTSLRHAGLALASSISYWVAGIMLCILLRKKLRLMQDGKPVNFDLMVSSIKIATATVIAGTGAWWLVGFAGQSPGFVRSCLFFSGGSLGFALMYILCLHVFKLPIKSMLKID